MPYSMVRIMITETELENIIKNWNPETDSVNVLKNTFEQYEGDIWNIDTDSLLNAILNLQWAEKYYEEYAFSAVSEFFCILAVDHEGNCLHGDYDKVSHISELENSFEKWIKDQEAKNETN